MVLIQGYNRILCTERRCAPNKLGQTLHQALYASLGPCYGQNGGRSCKQPLPELPILDRFRVWSPLAAEAASATPSVDEKMIERLLSHWFNGGGGGVKEVSAVGIEPAHAAMLIASFCVRDTKTGPLGCGPLGMSRIYKDGYNQPT